MTIVRQSAQIDLPFLLEAHRASSKGFAANADDVAFLASIDERAVSFWIVERGGEYSACVGVQWGAQNSALYVALYRPPSADKRFWRQDIRLLVNKTKEIFAAYRIETVGALVETAHPRHKALMWIYDRAFGLKLQAAFLGCPIGELK